MWWCSGARACRIPWSSPTLAEKTDSSMAIIIEGCPLGPWTQKFSSRDLFASLYQLTGRRQLEPGGSNTTVDTRPQPKRRPMPSYVAELVNGEEKCSIDFGTEYRYTELGLKSWLAASKARVADTFVLEIRYRARTPMKESTQSAPLCPFSSHGINVRSLEWRQLIPDSRIRQERRRILKYL